MSWTTKDILRLYKKTQNHLSTDVHAHIHTHIHTHCHAHIHTHTGHNIRLEERNQA